MIQTKLWLQGTEIIGLHIKQHYKRWKTCMWCGKTFLPHHNKQAYCDYVCRQISRQRYKSNWNYHRRIQNRDGLVVNDRAILNVGTGSLSEHPCSNERLELKKIQKELREIGLRR